MNKTILSFAFALISLHAFTQEIATFKVISGEAGRRDCPVSVELDQVNYNEDNGNLVLYEIIGNQRVAVPCQIETGHTTRFWFILTGETPAQETREFILVKQEGETGTAAVKLHKKHKSLNLSRRDSPVLDYQFRTMYPPEGVPLLFKRSGFIHPLWSPDGQVLTRVQAPDHYHHYGIWGPWTKTHIMGREVDFWNLMKGQGTVKFNGFLSESEGPVFSGFQAHQQHIDFGGRGEDQVAINEVLDVRTWNVGKGDVWLIDYTTTLNTPLDSGIMLDAYRYGGGIGFRATEKWHKDNSTVLTSEGKNRLNADGTKARWCIVEGESVSEEERSGILFMGHTSNREFPEPMRVWPVDANRGRGDVYFEFCPIRHKDWKLDKGRDYTLKYRLLVFDGSLSAEEAEMHWQGFANPPRVEIVNR